MKKGWIKGLNNLFKKIDSSLTEYSFIKKYLGSLSLTLIIIGVIILFVYVANDFDFLARYFYGGTNSVNGELLKTTLSAIGGIAVFYGLYLNSRRIEQQTEQNNINREGNSDKRFSDATGFLDSEKTSQIIGGIQILYQLAINEQRYRGIVSRTLSSYLKENSKELCEKYREENKDLCLRSAPFLITTIIEILQDTIFDDYEIDLSETELLGVVFKKEARNYNFRNSILEDCIFASNVINCNFEESHISQCKIGNMPQKLIIDNCKFDFATIKYTMFWGEKCLNLFFFNTSMINVTFLTNSILDSKFIGGNNFRILKPKVDLFTNFKLSFNSVTSFQKTIFEYPENISENNIEFFNCVETPKGFKNTELSRIV